MLHVTKESVIADHACSEAQKALSTRRHALHPLQIRPAQCASVSPSTPHARTHTLTSEATGSQLAPCSDRTRDAPRRPCLPMRTPVQAISVRTCNVQRPRVPTFGNKERHCKIGAAPSPLVATASTGGPGAASCRAMRVQASTAATKECGKAEPRSAPPAATRHHAPLTLSLCRR